MADLILPPGVRHRPTTLNVTVHNGKVVIQLDRLAKEIILSSGEAGQMAQALWRAAQVVQKQEKPEEMQ